MEHSRKYWNILESIKQHPLEDHRKLKKQNKKTPKWYWNSWFFNIVQLYVYCNETEFLKTKWKHINIIKSLLHFVIGAQY